MNMERYAPERTLLVDFDGTLCPFSWPTAPGEPYPGVVEALQQLKAKGFVIAIFTARAWSGWDEVVGEGYRARQLEEAALWLNRYRVPWDYMTAEKIPALYIIDDRAIQAGRHLDWARTVKEVVAEYERGQYGHHRTD